MVASGHTGGCVTFPRRRAAPISGLVRFRCRCEGDNSKRLAENTAVSGNSRADLFTIWREPETLLACERQVAEVRR